MTQEKYRNLVRRAVTNWIHAVKPDDQDIQLIMLTPDDWAKACEWDYNIDKTYYHKGMGRFGAGWEVEVESRLAANIWVTHLSSATKFINECFNLGYHYRFVANLLIACLDCGNLITAIAHPNTKWFSTYRLNSVHPDVTNGSTGWTEGKEVTTQDVVKCRLISCFQILKDIATEEGSFLNYLLQDSGQSLRGKHNKYALNPYIYTDVVDRNFVHSETFLILWLASQVTDYNLFNVQYEYGGESPKAERVFKWLEEHKNFSDSQIAFLKAHSVHESKGLIARTRHSYTETGNGIMHLRYMSRNFKLATEDGTFNLNDPALAVSLIQWTGPRAMKCIYNCVRHMNEKYGVWPIFASVGEFMSSDASKIINKVDHDLEYPEFKKQSDRFIAYANTEKESPKRFKTYKQIIS